jgi:hypothetical protein
MIERPSIAVSFWLDQPVGVAFKSTEAVIRKMADQINDQIDIGVKIHSGAGDPNAVVSAVKGSLYLNTTGSSTSTRAYINTDGATAWTAITTAT